jgi:hypothetical protein
MPATEPIIITTDSSPFDLAPAVLTVLEEAGDAGLESRTRFSPIANAVCDRFQVSRDEPRQRGTRHDSVQPDYNIEFAVTYLVDGGCIRKDVHKRFITTYGRELLKLPLADIHKLTAVFKATKREDLEESIKNLEESIDPDDHDARMRGLRKIVIRIDQVKFRRKIMEAYQGRCAITRSNVTQVLQAAHIKPYRGTPTNRVDNGLLLRVDLHQLFDKDLIGIHPETREIHISEELIGTEYEEFSARRLPEPVRQLPSRRSLEARWEKFLKANDRFS